ncbi:MAG: NAD-dependent epimerase/dehydratase family protein, partial [Candidatus Heimdallarchaeota archaeon]|nr:NAD-dependent epimerase/dehydratase family protein [Candidatus Heimdallarchaeota archaeon]
MVKKVLVTGSLGQIGSYLCEDLMQNNIGVIGLDNEFNVCPNLPKEVKDITVKGDIRDKSAVNKVMKKVDAVVHLAAQINVAESVKDPLFDAENNITGTLTLLQSAVKLPSIKRFVYISSAATYGNPVKLPIKEDHPQNPLSGYGISKLTGERYVNMYWQIHELPTVVIRGFNIYSKRADPKSPYSGVINRFIGQVKANKPPIIEGDGKQTRDFIYVSDVIQMIRAALEKKEAIGETFNCGCGKPTTVNQLANLIIKNSGKNIKS